MKHQFSGCEIKLSGDVKGRTHTHTHTHTHTGETSEITRDKDAATQT